MILNTGSRTDIPAYYSDWFYNRIDEGYVLTRNPYNPQQVLKYSLDPSVVDVLVFCTKNPKPMLSRIEKLKGYRQFWFVTLTPYGKDIEPNVPKKTTVIESIKQLSSLVGNKSVSYRYDPIFITEKYSLNYHLRAFEKIASELSGYVNSCVISFIDLYEKTKRNFPSVKQVTPYEQDFLAKNFALIGEKYNIPIRSCCENVEFKKYGIDVSGCMTKDVLENATNCPLAIPNNKKPPRAECNCLLGADIGAYNTCPHGCLYCYANYNKDVVKKNYSLHNPNSPFLIGDFRKEDIIVEVNQQSYIDNQLRLF